MAPYVNRPEFQTAVHYQVFDPTDFDFYRANPNVLRVIQKSPDPIALVETRMRNRAYRQTLAQKRDYFDTKLPIQHLNTAGMLVDYDTTKAPPAAFVPSRDSMLWSGVYVASQAMRYLATQDASALDNMLRSLDGLILCHKIVGVEGEFARTIREHVDDGSSWVQGTGGYAAWDWLPGGNNDMLQGYYVGFSWAYKVLRGLPGYDARKQKMADILNDLVSYNPDAGDTKLNEMKGRMLRHWMTGNLQDKLTYEALYAAGKTWLVDQGNGPLWEYGTSDWSGNHLIIQGLLVPYLVSTELGDGHASELSHGLRVALERMRHTRMGLFQMVGATLGDFPAPPPELEESLWVMREFPAPKVNHAFDWRINPSFCMSPFPSLPWKHDWTTNDRLDSLVAYPLFEKLPDVYAWKQGPFEFHDETSSVENSGVDYLFAYWFGRLHGVIQPGD